MLFVPLQNLLFEFVIDPELVAHVDHVEKIGYHVDFTVLGIDGFWNEENHVDDYVNDRDDEAQADCRKTSLKIIKIILF